MANDNLADGFTRVCVTDALNFAEPGCKIMLEAQYVAQPGFAITPDVPIAITDWRNLAGMFGAGSQAHRLLEIVRCICGDNGDVTLLPREDAAGATKAVYEMTVTGPATSDGTIDIFAGNEDYAISVAASSGDTADAIAALIQAEFDAIDAFPYVVTVAANVVTFTAVNGGTVGNYFAPVINWRGRQSYFPQGVAITVARTTAGATDPAAIDYAAALGGCCYACYVMPSETLARQRAMRDWIRSNWDCDKPQCFGHAYTFDSGTLGAVLAKGDNSKEFNRIAVPANDLNFPDEIVAADAALSCCTACSNPERSIQGRVNGRLYCVKRPATCSTPWSYAEAVQLAENGFNVYGPLNGGAGGLTDVYMYTDITNSLYDDKGRKNLTWRDTSSRRLDTAIAVAVAVELNKLSGVALYSASTQIKQGKIGTNINMIRAEFISWLREQEGSFWSRFDDIEKQVRLRESSEIEQPCRGVPGLLYLDLIYKRPPRIVGVKVNLAPSMLDNCYRDFTVLDAA